jgi:hypothetical protein
MAPRAAIHVGVVLAKIDPQLEYLMWWQIHTHKAGALGLMVD